MFFCNELINCFFSCTYTHTYTFYFFADDNNLSIEIPLLVQNLTEQHLDMVPEYRVDQVSEMQLIVTQRTFDCEQFIYRQAEKLCQETNYEFLHCDDYDIKIIHVSLITNYGIFFLTIGLSDMSNKWVHCLSSRHKGGCVEDFRAKRTATVFQFTSPVHVEHCN